VLLCLSERLIRRLLPTNIRDRSIRMMRRAHTAIPKSCRESESHSITNDMIRSVEIGVNVASIHIFSSIKLPPMTFIYIVTNYNKN